MPLNASLHIITKLQHQKTILKSGYCTQPFKIANITPSGKGKELRLMLMSSSPGVLDGDVYNMQIEVGEGCCLSLETQSFQRLFQMKKGASQTMVVQVAEGASLKYLPHPVVPHRHSIYSAKTKIDLSAGCRLLWAEVISCGRKLNGEMFCFSSLHSLTEIYLHQKLVVKENLFLKPDLMNLTALGHLEGYTHQSTLLYLDEKAAVPQLINKVVALLNGYTEIAFGVSALPVNGLVIRMMGNKAEQLFGLQKQLAMLLPISTTVETKKIPEPYVI